MLPAAIELVETDLNGRIFLASSNDFNMPIDCVSYVSIHICPTLFLLIKICWVHSHLPLAVCFGFVDLQSTLRFHPQSDVFI